MHHGGVFRNSARPACPGRRRTCARWRGLPEVEHAIDLHSEPGRGPIHGRILVVLRRRKDSPAAHASQCLAADAASTRRVYADRVVSRIVPSGRERRHVRPRNRIAANEVSDHDPIGGDNSAGTPRTHQCDEGQHFDDRHTDHRVLSWIRSPADAEEAGDHQCAGQPRDGPSPVANVNGVARLMSHGA
jgi:hypothetical protein